MRFEDAALPAEGLPSDLQASRTRVVRLDPSVVFGQFAVLAPGSPVTVELFEDVTIDLTTVWTEVREAGAGWYGHGTDRNGSPAEMVLTIDGPGGVYHPDTAVVRATATALGRSITLRPVAPGVAVIGELAGKASGATLLPADVRHAAPTSRGPIAIASHTSTTTWLDVVVGFTPAALALDPAVEADIAHEIDRANAANTASGTGFRFRVVNRPPSNNGPESANLGNDLDDLQRANDGRWDGIHDRRDEFGGDVVILLAHHPEWAPCGLANFSIDENRAGHADQAFGIVNAACARDLSLAHETGHVLALRHAWGDVDTGSGIAEAGNHSPYADNHGFRFCVPSGAVPGRGQTVHTIMAYPASGGAVDTMSCTTEDASDLQLDRWSDPDLSQGGRPIGVRDQPGTLDQPADNARVIAITDDVVRQYRGHTAAGDPWADHNPVGRIEDVDRHPSGARVRGWLLDPDTDDSIHYEVRVDGVVAATGTASGIRTGVAEDYPGYGSAHGTNAVAAMSQGVSHNICLRGVNVGSGSDTTVACQAFTPNPDPTGSLSSVRQTPGGVGTVSMRVGGWALDRGSASAISVRISATHSATGGVTTRTVTANRSNSYVAQNWADWGANHGFDETFQVPLAGAYRVCATALNIGPGSDAGLGCLSVTLAVVPLGTADPVSRSLTTARVTGWTLDPETAAPINVEIRLDGINVLSITANGSDARSGADWPDYGTNHGFDVTIPVPAAGTHQVCVDAINVGQGQNVTLQCATI